MSTSGALVREARSRRGMTARDLANAARVSVSTVTRIEKGQMNPTVQMLERLLNAASADLVVAAHPRQAQPPTLAVLRDHAALVDDIVSRHGGSNVRVFGSVARGETRPCSDVDLLIDVPPGTGLFEVARIEDELNDALPWRVDVVTSGAAHGRLRHIVAEAVRL